MPNWYEKYYRLIQQCKELTKEKELERLGNSSSSIGLIKSTI